MTFKSWTVDSCGKIVPSYKVRSTFILVTAQLYDSCFVSFYEHFVLCRTSRLLLSWTKLYMPYQSLFRNYVIYLEHLVGTFRAAVASVRPSVISSSHTCSHQRHRRRRFNPLSATGQYRRRDELQSYFRHVSTFCLLNYRVMSWSGTENYATRWRIFALQATLHSKL